MQIVVEELRPLRRQFRSVLRISGCERIRDMLEQAAVTLARKKESDRFGEAIPLRGDGNRRVAGPDAALQAAVIQQVKLEQGLLAADATKFRDW